jgi:hypothetical protein
MEDNLQGIDMAMIATEVGFEAVFNLIDYYIAMLGLSVMSIAESTGSDPMNVYKLLEEKLGLVGKLDASLNMLKASTEVNKSTFKD